SPYWQVGLGYAFIGIGVGFAGTPASRSLTGSVPVKRAGMASGTADLQRDLGGAIMQSIFGALLTAGYAAAIASAVATDPNGQQITSSTEATLQKSFASAAALAHNIRSMPTRSSQQPSHHFWLVINGPTWLGSLPSCWELRSSSSCSRS
ncbi:MAG TPA: hypothetical protein VIY29_30430, partial [Ktedonobacteraceae bacterium]